MNFSLEHFELHFSTDLLPAGEQLYELGAILIFEEIEHSCAKQIIIFTQY